MRPAADTRVRLSGRLICASLDEAEIIHNHLPEHIRLTQAEPCCLSFRVWQTSDPLIWGVEECFRSADAFFHHQQRTRNSVWWTATQAIARQYEITGLESGPET